MSSPIIFDAVIEVYIYILYRINKIDPAMSIDFFSPGLGVCHASLTRLVSCILLQEIVYLLPNFLVRLVTHLIVFD